MVTRTVFLGLVLLAGLAVGAVAWDVEGNLTLSTLRMGALNEIMEDYALEERMEPARLSMGAGGDVTVRIPLFQGAFEVVGGLRGVFAAIDLEREHIETFTLGGFVGAGYSLGAWRPAVDLGIYRATLDFAAGGYEDVSGWGVGLCATLVYRLELSSRMIGNIALSTTWLPVTRLTNSRGDSYEVPGKDLLDFSGFGLTVGIGWKSQ